MLGQHGGVRHAGGTQRLGARGLGHGEISRVIDDAAGIGVRIIDPAVVQMGCHGEASCPTIIEEGPAARVAG